MKHIVGWLLILGLVVAVARGCESDDVRIARLAQDAAARQAEQNREITRLVESQQALQQDLDTQRGHLDHSTGFGSQSGAPPLNGEPMQPPRS
jgi:hypothetical protein